MLNELRVHRYENPRECIPNNKRYEHWKPSPFPATLPPALSSKTPNPRQTSASHWDGGSDNIDGYEICAIPILSRTRIPT